MFKLAVRYRTNLKGVWIGWRLRIQGLPSCLPRSLVSIFKILVSTTPFFLPSSSEEILENVSFGRCFDTDTRTAQRFAGISSDYSS